MKYVEIDVQRIKPGNRKIFLDNMTLEQCVEKTI